ncbi:ATP-grasp domain-containing protein [Paenibacillus thermotolerans]|uniref:ATP-grasp domain-containing protein n=1 Tax=Paenibacillus thermotolerans TaxID=3027807 RepID=UPI0023688D13|nr:MULTISPECIES: RimK family alpha-L-glutamate ligase [unclassified Paenibacillus]
MKLTCAIVYNGALKSEKFMYQIRWLARTAKELGFDASLIGNNELIPAIEGGRSVLKGKYAGYAPDFFFFWDKDVRLARHLENMGFKLFNGSSAIEICDDKTRTYQVLADHGMPIPKTMLPPMIYDNCELEDVSGLEYIAEELGFPMVIKEAFGSFGEQVYLIGDREQLIRKARELGSKPYLFQELVRSSYGRDVRLNVVGDRVEAAMLRKSEHDFRANVTAGGNMFPYEPTDAQKEVAVRCAKLVGADFAGVDLLFGEHDEPIVCEINSNAHFKNIYDCTGVDLAQKMLTHIKEELSR